MNNSEVIYGDYKYLPSTNQIITVKSLTAIFFTPWTLLVNILLVFVWISSYCFSLYTHSHTHPHTPTYTPNHLFFQHTIIIIGHIHPQSPHTIPCFCRPFTSQSACLCTLFMHQAAGGTSGQLSALYDVSLDSHSCTECPQLHRPSLGPPTYGNE